jgi:hypothetical protein
LASFLRSLQTKTSMILGSVQGIRDTERRRTGASFGSGHHPPGYGQSQHRLETRKLKLGTIGQPTADEWHRII